MAKRSAGGAGGIIHLSTAPPDYGPAAGPARGGLCGPAARRAAAGSVGAGSTTGHAVAGAGMERIAGGENALSRRVHAAPSAAAGIAEFSPDRRGGANGSRPGAAADHLAANRRNRAEQRISVGIALYRALPSALWFTAEARTLSEFAILSVKCERKGDDNGQYLHDGMGIYSTINTNIVLGVTHG